MLLPGQNEENWIWTPEHRSNDKLSNIHLQLSMKKERMDPNCVLF